MCYRRIGPDKENLCSQGVVCTERSHVAIVCLRPLDCGKDKGYPRKRGGPSSCKMWCTVCAIGALGQIRKNFVVKVQCALSAAMRL